MAYSKRTNFIFMDVFQNQKIIHELGFIAKL